MICEKLNKTESIHVSRYHRPCFMCDNCDLCGHLGMKAATAAPSLTVLRIGIFFLRLRFVYDVQTHV